MREVRLNNGVMMPSVGFGVYQIDKNETKAAVFEALEVGYRMIDTAASYFNEREVGEAIRESGLPRESVFVTSKLWVQDYEYDDALSAFDRSLSHSVLTTLTSISCINLTAITTPPGVLLSVCTRKAEFVRSV